MLSLSLGFIFGLLFGSLVKCLADRSTTDESFLGRSYCPRCKHQLRWYDLFPILSYLFLKGRCRYCRRPIPFEYPLVEVVTAIITAGIFYFYLPDQILINPDIWIIIPLLSVALKILVVLIGIATIITDLKTGLIPDRLTYPASFIAFGLMLTIIVSKISYIGFNLTHNDLGKYLVPPFSSYFYERALQLLYPLGFNLITAFSAASFFGLIILVTHGRGMGGGDLKLAFFMGLVLGFPSIIVALMLAFLTGSIVGICLILLKKRKMHQTIPFGPFLSLGMIAALFWGDRIANWYLNFHPFPLN